MTDKARIYKRKELTEDRRKEMGALIASNLIGLHLTPHFGMDCQA